MNLISLWNNCKKCKQLSKCRPADLAPPVSLIQVICQVTDRLHRSWTCLLFYLRAGLQISVVFAFSDMMTISSTHIQAAKDFLTFTRFLLCTFILAAASWYSKAMSNQSDVTMLSHSRWVCCLWELWTPGYFGDGNVLTVCVFASVVFILIKSSAAADFLHRFILSGSVARVASLHKTIKTDK